MNKQYAQGDVLIVPVDKMPRGKSEPVESGVVAYGEVTGHAHRLSGRFELMRFSGNPNELFLHVQDGGASLKHEEHAEIALPPGNFRVTTQREWTPEAVRNVAD